MSTYSQIAWLPLAGGLTIVGLIASWIAWRRRGAGAGLRGVAWSLLPVAAYLTGAIKMLWQMGEAISSFASSFIARHPRLPRRARPGCPRPGRGPP